MIALIAITLWQLRFHFLERTIIRNKKMGLSWRWWIHFSEESKNIKRRFGMRKFAAISFHETQIQWSSQQSDPDFLQNLNIAIREIKWFKSSWVIQSSVCWQFFHRYKFTFQTFFFVIAFIQKVNKWIQKSEHRICFEFLAERGIRN